MQRDARLHGLSSEHHHALVLARSMAALAAGGRATAADGRALAERFARELEPHFRIEEDVLLPALRAAGEQALVQAIETDHAFLRQQAARAAAGHLDDLAAFAERLAEHVRLEERRLFPVCEAVLPGHVLDEVARRAPKVAG